MKLANHTLKHALIGGLACTMLPLAGLAAKPVDGWYLGGFGGVSDFPGNVSVTASDGATRSNANYKLGYNFGGNLGYKSGPMRYELQISYLNAKTKSFNRATVAQTGVSGRTDVIPGLLNVYYDFDEEMGGDLIPYLGVGIGYAHIGTKLNSTGPSGTTTFKATDNEFAYQGSLGINYNFDEQASVTLAYQYLGTTKSSKFGKRFQAHSGTLGLVYRFDNV